MRQDKPNWFAGTTVKRW